MKKFYLLLLVFPLIIAGCKENSDNIDNQETIVNQPETYQAIISELPADSTYKIVDSNVVKLANPIIYDVIVKNPNEGDEWTEYCLSKTDRQTIVKILFAKVLAGELTPYDHITDTIMSLDDVKKLQAENSLDNIGKLQFEEEWYFDAKTNKFYKVVKSIVFGYELKNDQGEIYGYKPGFKVFFDERNRTSK